MSTLEEKAKGLADNALFTVAARFIMFLGVPVTLLIGGYIANSLSTLLEHRAVTLRVQQDVERRVTALEQQNVRDAEAADRLNSRLGGIDRLLATLTADTAATRRVMERVENFLDARRVAPKEP